MMFKTNPRTRTRDISYLILWIVFILLVGVLPLRNFVGHAHWEYIKWIPIPTAEDLRSPKYLLDISSDIVGNALLFLPLGYVLRRLLTSSSPLRQLLIAAGIGGTLSLGIELYQVYCHNRFPSIFDIITNVTGTLLGVRLPLFSRKSVPPALEHLNRAPNPEVRRPTP
jgi:glycopeptide antibiotics resistance protein